jgi:hypothetical protein
LKRNTPIPYSTFGLGTRHRLHHQGRLNNRGNPANGTYDRRFTMLDAPAGGSALGVRTNAATAIGNGLFTVTMDFGAGMFTGAERWLEIGVRTND